MPDLPHFRCPVFSGGPNPWTVLSGACIELHKTCRWHRAIIAAHQVCFRFQLLCSISKHKALKGKWCRKEMPNFTLFDPCKK